MYDLAIIGAGPAGATLARLVGTGFKVLLLDKRNFGGANRPPFTKCCGGLIAPDAQHMLGKLGLGVPGNVLVGPQLFTVRTLDLAKSLERYYQRHYININREKFDAWLVSLLPPGVEFRGGCTFKTFENLSNCIRLSFTYKGKVYVEKTKLLVGADGAFSRVRRLLQPREAQIQYIALQEWFKVPKSPPYFSVIFDSTVTDYYAWTIPKEDCLLVGAALWPQRDTTLKFKLLKQKLRCCGFELSEQVKKEGAYINRPISLKHISLGEGNIALIGEAAGWISPTSAEGFSYALRSSLALAQSLHEDRDEQLRNYLREYRRKTTRLKLNICAKIWKAPFMYKAKLREMVMKSGLTSMKIAAQ